LINQVEEFIFLLDTNENTTDFMFKKILYGVASNLHLTVVQTDTLINERRKSKKPIRKSYSNRPPIEMIKVPGINILLGKYPVKNGEYGKFCDNTKSHWPELLEAENDFHVYYGIENFYSDYRKNINYPVTGVSAIDADAFCKWMGGRLPTEDEWEYAAKGAEEFLFSGSNSIAEVAWYKGNSVGERNCVQAQQVGMLNANGYGLYDMSGNVWEWTSTRNGAHRVNRGGCYNSSAHFCRVTSSRFSPEEGRGPVTGFRLALPL